MNTQRRTADEQYQLIMECRNSGLSDYQWCTEHDINPGTFYNWVKRLRKKACYDIPPANGRETYRATPKQEVVKLEVIPDVPTVMDSKSLETIRTDRRFSSSIEIQSGTVSIRISNDVDPMLLSQIIRCMAENVC